MANDFRNDDFEDDSPAAPRDDEMSGGCGCVLPAVLAGAAVTVLLCAGLGGVAYWGWTMFEGQAAEAIGRNAVVREHLGEVESVDADLVATGEAADDVFVFEVRGTKGAGTVSAELVSVEADTEEVRSGTLRLPSGEVYDLVPPTGDVAPPGGPRKR